MEMNDCDAYIVDKINSYKATNQTILYCRAIREAEEATGIPEEISILNKISNKAVITLKLLEKKSTTKKYRSIL